jgi:hypothetical protein
MSHKLRHLCQFVCYLCHNVSQMGNRSPNGIAPGGSQMWLEIRRLWRCSKPLPPAGKPDPSSLPGLRVRGRQPWQTSIPGASFAKAIAPNGYEPCGTCDVCRSQDNPGLFDYLNGNRARQLSAAAAKDGSDAVQAVIDQLGFQNSPIIIDEADRLMIQQHRLFSLLEKPLAFSIIFNSVYPEKFNPQFVVRCVVLETELATREQTAGLIKREAIKEGVEFSDDEVEAILTKMALRNVMGQPRSAMVYLEQHLLVRTISR